MTTESNDAANDAAPDAAQRDSAQPDSAQPDSAEAIAQALSRLRGTPTGGEGRGRAGARAAVVMADRADGTEGPTASRRGKILATTSSTIAVTPGCHRGWPTPRVASAAPARMRMLEALAAASAPLSVSDLGAAIGVDQPRASRLVQQGVERGYVRREADPDDARRTRIALTDEGRRLARGMRGERREMLATALTSFTEEERVELARLLNKLADNWQR